MQCRFAWLVVILVLLSIPPAQSQAQNTGPQTVMATRTVTKYLALERGLLEAIAQQNSDAANRILGADFESRTPDNQEPVTREDWIKSAFNHAQSRGQIRDLSATETDGMTLVSFVLEMKTGKNKAVSYFIIDAWQQSTDQLLVRYQVRPAHQPKNTERPDGRE